MYSFLLPEVIQRLYVLRFEIHILYVYTVENMQTKVQKNHIFHHRKNRLDTREKIPANF